jgi:hypothetical protein
MARQMVAHLEYDPDDVKFHRERLRCTRHRVGSDLAGRLRRLWWPQTKSGKFEGADSVLGPPSASERIEHICGHGGSTRITSVSPKNYFPNQACREPP